MKFEISVVDIEILTYQLKRKPRGDFFVSVRCTYGNPMVLTNSPFIDGKPFPTTYWLTCPARIKAVSGLESDGWVIKMEKELTYRNDWKEMIDETVKLQIEARKNMLPEADASIDESLLSGGIAGTGNRYSVKCLHAHLADFLVNRINPVGEKTANLIGGIDCDRECDR